MGTNPNMPKPSFWTWAREDSESTTGETMTSSWETGRNKQWGGVEEDTKTRKGWGKGSGSDESEVTRSQWSSTNDAQKSFGGIGAGNSADVALPKAGWAWTNADGNDSSKHWSGANNDTRWGWHYNSA